MKKTVIHIPEPCREDWDAMKQGEREAYCEVCSKNVKDLTSYSLIELTQYFEDLKDGTCVRLPSNQLELPIVPSQNVTQASSMFNLTAGLVFASTLSLSPVIANSLNNLINRKMLHIYHLRILLLETHCADVFWHLIRVYL